MVPPVHTTAAPWVNFNEHHANVPAPSVLEQVQYLVATPEPPITMYVAPSITPAAHVGIVPVLVGGVLPVDMSTGNGAAPNINNAVISIAFLMPLSYHLYH